MTDRVKGCTVVFDHDIREDDVQALCQAISCFRGVASVKLEIVHCNDYMDRERIRLEYQKKIFDVLKES